MVRFGVRRLDGEHSNVQRSGVRCPRARYSCGIRPYAIRPNGLDHHERDLSEVSLDAACRYG